MGNPHPAAGMTLQQAIKVSGPLNNAAVIRIAAELAQQLDATHKKGLVYRDLSPSTVVLEKRSGRVVISAGTLPTTESGHVDSAYEFDTSPYMAPEQAAGTLVDQRADLYTLGCLLYFASTGHSPVGGHSPDGVRNRVIKEQPPEIDIEGTDLAEWLPSFVECLLEKRPQRRMKSAKQVYKLLKDELAAAGPSPSVHSPVMLSPAFDEMSNPTEETDDFLAERGKDKLPPYGGQQVKYEAPLIRDQGSPKPLRISDPSDEFVDAREQLIYAEPVKSHLPDEPEELVPEPIPYEPMAVLKPVSSQDTLRLLRYASLGIAAIIALGLVCAILGGLFALISSPSDRPPSSSASETIETSDRDSQKSTAATEDWGPLPNSTSGPG